MVRLYWSLMQLAEDSKDVEVPLSNLAFLSDVDVASLDPATYFKYMQLVVMTQLRLEDPTDGSAIGVDFQKIFNQVMSLSEGQKELIVSESTATKSNSAAVSEVRAILRRHLEFLFTSEEGREAED